MKQDLDRLMEERGLDAALVAGHLDGNPALVYMLNGAAVSQGYVIKRRGHEPVFFCSSLEREEALASGLPVVNLNKFDYLGVLQKVGDHLAADVELYRRMFAELDVRGRVGFYGMSDRGRAWMLLNALQERLEGIEVRGEYEVTLFDAARGTKDTAEAERIHAVGRATEAIVGETLEFLCSHAVKDGALVESDGAPLTIGRVHAEIRRLIAAHGLEDPEGFIFSIGRDAGIPHSKGAPEDIMMLGRTIVYDIFPREPGGGYFFDMTRTFCLGYAPPEVERAYRDVADCVEHLMAAYEVGSEMRRYQRMTCEFFESRGHPTVASDSTTEVGYTHSIGHGLGLAIHEEPFFSDNPTNTGCLLPGHIFSCEPGLYYPDEGLGVRIEDVVWIDEGGRVHDLTAFPKELVVEVS
ncbi:MAG: aminopeptidase P family protein [Anaerolineales bacterium]|nr:aminopeptidase P family protein [Anaerolineales bacterium]